MKNVLIRTDSSSYIGLGHMTRCLVLAQRIKQEESRVSISFATQDLLGNINDKIVENGFLIRHLKSNSPQELIDLIKALNLSLLIIDNYDISSEEEKWITQQLSCKVLVFDDFFRQHTADMVLNHGIQVEKSAYQELVPPNTKIFCGSECTLLRDEFFSKTLIQTEQNHIAIMLGGNDVLNLSGKIAHFLRKLNKNYTITIITTRSNRNLRELEKFAFFNLVIDSSAIAKVLQKQEIVICASGGCLFEVMALKKKFINVQVVNNQQSIVDFLEQKNIRTSMYHTELSLENLKEKINYVKKHNIYQNLPLYFSKTNLTKQIMKEIT